MMATIIPQAIIIGQYNGQGVHCGPHTAFEVFLIFTTQLEQYFSMFFFYLH